MMEGKKQTNKRASKKKERRKKNPHIYTREQNGSATLGVFTHRNLLIFLPLLRYATPYVRDFKDVKDISIL